LNGISSGTSSAVGAVAPLRQSVTPDAPASGGYAWSFSGDSTTILDVNGFIDGLARSSARVGGVIGHTGRTTATMPTEGYASGRVRIREDDDLELLQLLGLL
jgi:hypothetical protein